MLCYSFVLLCILVIMTVITVKIIKIFGNSFQSENYESGDDHN